MHSCRPACLFKKDIELRILKTDSFFRGICWTQSKTVKGCRGRGRAAADSVPKRDTICEFHARWTIDELMLHRLITWHIEDHTQMCKLDPECVESIHRWPPGYRLKDSGGLKCVWCLHCCFDLWCPAHHHSLIIWLILNVPLVCQWAYGDRSRHFNLFCFGNDATFFFLVLSHLVDRKEKMRLV